MPKIVFISDTHGQYMTEDVPDGDILVHCGDWSSYGSFQESASFNEWLGKLPHEHKLITPGNHDIFTEKNTKQLNKEFFTNATYIQDELIEVMGLKFWGSPWSKRWGRWAWMRESKDLINIYNEIPEGIDVFFSHGPPYGKLDSLGTHKGAVRAGCHSLTDAIERIKPRIFACGHIHESGGQNFVEGVTQYINCAVLDGTYQIGQNPIVVDLSVK